MKGSIACIGFICMIMASNCLIRSDAIIEGNTMRTQMPANKLVFVSIEGKGAVRVDANLNGQSDSISCKSTSDHSVCLLWDSTKNAFNLNSSPNDIINLDLVSSLENGQKQISYKVVSGSVVVLPSSSTSIQMNNLVGVPMAVSAECPAGSGLQLSASRMHSSEADYLNRLSMNVYDRSGSGHLHTSTDASGRQAQLHLNAEDLKEAKLESNILIGLKSEKAGFIHLATNCGSGSNIGIGHLGQTTGSTSFFRGKLTSMEVGHFESDPKYGDLADDHDTHWLRDGAKEFKVLEDEVEILERVGMGHFGSVVRVKDKKLNKELVAKRLRKSASMSRMNGANEINREVSVLNVLPIHPNVCQFFRAFETLEEVVIIMENCGSTSLYARYSNRRANEAEVRFFLKQMVAGQVALQKAHIYQVDVKMTNMQITHEGVLKIIDFGLARRSDESTLGRVGADGYYSPEMLLGQTYHPSKIDTWNDGICIYKMLYGNYCFGMLVDDDYVENIKTLYYTFPSYPRISDELKNLFGKLFQFQDKRYSVFELAADPWLTRG